MTDAIRFRALEIARSLGVRKAAGYLRNRDVPLEAAVALLARRA